ncbi:hypothetical protein [Noviherbaspirillum galbum]|uniref:Uncharacterized protein n=1 Tax=Noviherbaspirillum galbum TaxID=2709383 RepID=A0A6B3SH70_9BURK|nr:hypothetical protein [Noviherbaspirillum galbum]NEX60194.1 hypothetical protein [Noviherbaspirillum galbum]
MTLLTIRDLPQDQELDSKALSTIRGGTNSWLAGLGSVANVNIGINQNIQQLQNVQVNALNNIGVIGAGFVPPNINVSPSQWANAAIAI